MNLSEKEREVIESNEDLLKPLAEGKGLKQIAADIGKKPKVVQKRVERIRLTLGYANIVQLIHKCTIHWVGKNTTSDADGMIGG